MDVKKEEAAPILGQMRGDEAPELDDEDKAALDKTWDNIALDMLANPAKYGKSPDWPGFDKIRKHYGITK